MKNNGRLPAARLYVENPPRSHQTDAIALIYTMYIRIANF